MNRANENTLMVVLLLFVVFVSSKNEHKIANGPSNSDVLVISGGVEIITELLFLFAGR